MRNKVGDILYCNVDVEKIRTANPKLRPDKLKLWIDYQYERAKIYHNKEVLKLPQPWTENEVLQTYSFTNVRREWDKSSRWLIEKVLRQDLTILNKLCNIVLGRCFYSTFFFLNDLKEGYVNFDISKDEKDSYFDYVSDSIKLQYEGAYMVSSLRKIAYKEANNPQSDKDKILAILNYIFREKENLKKTFLDKEQQDEILKCEIPGIKGRFLLYQIWLDLCFIPEYKFSPNEFVLSGPGCAKGIAILVEDLDGLTDEEFMFWFRDYLYESKDFNEKEVFFFCDEEQQNYGVNEIENSFCEFQKYHRYLFDKGNKRIKIRKYKNGIKNQNSKEKGKNVTSLSDF